MPDALEYCLFIKHFSFNTMKQYNRKIMQRFNNMHLAQNFQYTDKNKFPILKPYQGTTDLDFHCYADRNKLSGKNYGIHFFMYDNKFDNAVWNRLEITTKSLSKFGVLMTPDYSLFVNDYCLQPNKEAIYKTRYVGAYWQSRGLKVIPTVSWGNADSFEYAFEGLPTDSVLGLCGVGYMHDKSSRELWKYGVLRVQEELKPRALIIYGHEVEIEGLDVELIFIKDHITQYYRKDDSGKPIKL